MSLISLMSLKSLVGPVSLISLMSFISLISLIFSSKRWQAASSYLKISHAVVNLRLSWVSWLKF